jgi:hypothetical protein
MKSLYDELSEKLSTDPRKVGPRADMGLLLFANRHALRDLWTAADRCDRIYDPETLSGLHGVVEKLRPLFGERAG